MLGRTRSIRLALCLLGFLCVASVSVAAQEPDDKKDQPSEGFADTLERMKIKRAVEEHKKLVKSAHQAAEIAERLHEDVYKEKLLTAAEKKLKEIEKAAKQIRNYVGSSNDEKDFEPPTTLDEAITQTVSTTKLLSEQMDKTSRHLVNATIIVSSSNLLRLIKILRTYVN